MKKILLLLNIIGIILFLFLLVNNNKNTVNLHEKNKVSERQRLIREELNQVQSKVNHLEDERKGTFSFGFVTDSHYENGIGGLQQYFSLQNVSENIPMRFIVHGGDLINGYKNKNQSLKDLNKMKQILSDTRLPVYLVKGNHDDNSYYVRDTQNSTTTDMITEKEWKENVDELAENKLVRDEDNPLGAYYYKDIKDVKVRIIVLNSNDVPVITTNSGKPKYYGINKYAFSSQQLKWVATKALNFSSKNNSSEWQTIFISHVPLYGSMSLPNDPPIVNSSVMDAIILAFKNGKSIDIPERTDEFRHDFMHLNYEKQGKMTVIGYLSGHTHAEKSQVINGINYITFLHALARPDGGPQRNTPMTAGAWSVVTVNTEKRKIFITGFGAATNREYTY
ncbi:metallophosphoesterase [Priestia megaterium]